VESALLGLKAHEAELGELSQSLKEREEALRAG
jgi:hypothetical protein